MADPLSSVKVEVKVLAFNESKDGKSATVEFVVLSSTSSTPEPLDKQMMQNVVKNKTTEISAALGVQKMNYIEPATSPSQPSNSTTAIIVVCVLVAMVIVLVALVLAFQRKQRIQGNRVQYLNDNSQQHQFENAAFDNKTETVQIGSFDRS
jgi:uncharacterized protein HemX